jgi:hypothetical protein
MWGKQVADVIWHFAGRGRFTSQRNCRPSIFFTLSRVFFSRWFGILFAS